MKGLILVLISLIITSCGPQYTNPAPYTAPAELQGGTWINLDGSGVTTELDFNSGNVTASTFSAGNPAVNVDYRIGFSDVQYKFPVTSADNGEIWEIRNLLSNSVTICTPSCKDFTR